MNLLQFVVPQKMDNQFQICFFGAVHYLLLKGADHPLKDFYPSIVSNPKSYEDSFEYFKDFCLTHRNEIE